MTSVFRNVLGCLGLAAMVGCTPVPAEDTSTLSYANGDIWAVKEDVSGLRPSSQGSGFAPTNFQTLGQLRSRVPAHAYRAKTIRFSQKAKDTDTLRLYVRYPQNSTIRYGVYLFDQSGNLRIAGRSTVRELDQYGNPNGWQRFTSEGGFQIGQVGRVVTMVAYAYGGQSTSGYNQAQMVVQITGSQTGNQWEVQDAFARECRRGGQAVGLQRQNFGNSTYERISSCVCNGQRVSFQQFQTMFVLPGRTDDFSRECARWTGSNWHGSPGAWNQRDELGYPNNNPGIGGYPHDNGNSRRQQAVLNELRLACERVDGAQFQNWGSQAVCACGTRNISVNEFARSFRYNPQAFMNACSQGATGMFEAHCAQVGGRISYPSLNEPMVCVCGSARLSLEWWEADPANRGDGFRWKCQEGFNGISHRDGQSHGMHPGLGGLGNAGGAPQGDCTDPGVDCTPNQLDLNEFTYGCEDGGGKQDLLGDPCECIGDRTTRLTYNEATSHGYLTQQQVAEHVAGLCSAIGG